MADGRGVLGLCLQVLLILTTVTRMGEGSLYRYSWNATKALSERDANNLELKEYDTVTLDNYLRPYLRGSINDEVAFYDHDVISCYAGPGPHFQNYSTFVTAPTGSSGKEEEISFDVTVRAWAMFDEKAEKACSLNQVHDWGELAFFSCPKPAKSGLYRAYAVDIKIKLSEESKDEKEDKITEAKSGDGDGLPTFPLLVHKPTLAASKIPHKGIQIWNRKSQLLIFDMMRNKDAKFLLKAFNQTIEVGKDEEEEDITRAKIRALSKLTKFVASDPVAIRKSFFCYYWMFQLELSGQGGYVKKEVVPSLEANSSSYKQFNLRIWVAEPSAVAPQESDGRIGQLEISAYSRTITNRFYDTGLQPCLRQAHKVVEIVSPIRYVSEKEQSNPLSGAPHWLAMVKVHTDRLITTFSDITFTIASRQNTGSFHCFVGDTKVYIGSREFTFVEQGKLLPESVNLKISNIWDENKINVRNNIRTVSGHGVQFIGNFFTKLYQPATNRTDIRIVNNPCMSQEFAISMGGTLYLATGFLRTGMRQVQKVVLPDFSTEYGLDTDESVYRNYLRVSDVVFIPTHAIFLLYDGSAIFHPTSARMKGVGREKSIHKYRPKAFVRRRTCPRTSTPKFSGMMVPLYSRSGNIIVVQLYSIEGSLRMWTNPAPKSCVGEGVKIVGKTHGQTVPINETNIHYEDFVKVERTNHRTGLVEPPPPERPAPPPPPQVNLDEDTDYLLNDGQVIVEGKDPHFPPKVLDPARHSIGVNLTNYNSAVIYVLELEEKGFNNLLTANGFDVQKSKEDVGLYRVEFAAVEKQFITALKFTAPTELDPSKKFQIMVITTVTVTNLPFRVKLQRSDSEPDENLDTLIPFPGTVIVRSKPFMKTKGTSLDPEEEEEHLIQLIGKTEVEFTPELNIMNTAIPSYVLNFGDILVYTSLESRYARPLHFYEEHVIDKIRRSNSELPDREKKKPHKLSFNESRIRFARENRTHDAVVTDQGIVSVLWRKERRFLKEIDPSNFSSIQTVALGSVVSLEPLREVKPFYHQDNIFQRVTPDGDVIYGIYDVQPHAPFKTCVGGPDITQLDKEACIERETDANNSVIPPNGTFPYCGRDVGPPCKSLETLPLCSTAPEETDGSGSSGSNSAPPTPKPAPVPVPDKNKPTTDTDESETASNDKTCLRVNKLTCVNQTRVNTAYDCWPRHAPKEELREINFLGTPFLSYLLGSMLSVKSTHPELPHVQREDEEDKDDNNKEKDICPFSSFKVHFVSFDFAEVGYQTRVTGEISYFGIGIPTEADMIVEFENVLGVVIEVSSSVEEQRGLTTIRKTLDITFRMTDLQLRDVFSPDRHAQSSSDGKNKLDFDDVRAREKSTVFSVTIRPSILNNHCKSSDFFKTVQFSVGCNTFSTIRLVAEAAPFTRMDMNQKGGKGKSNNKWKVQGDTLSVPATQVYYRQRDGVLNCTGTGPDSKCIIPFRNLFEENIFTVSYRDLFYPKFEQFLTVSVRPVTGNVVLYDLLGSIDFDMTVNNLEAGCHTTGQSWFEALVNTTKYFEQGSTEHENVYKYFVDCFDTAGVTQERAHELSATHFHLHNLTNDNKIKFQRKRNHILIFRAVLVNTEYNRFSYCKTLETFFLVRVVGIPIPRQALKVWHYIVIVFFVLVGLVISYLIFFYFYTWQLDAVKTAGAATSQEPQDGDETGEQPK